jgi:hypothetical protein
MNAVFSLLLLTVLVFLLQVITGRVRRMPFVFNNVLAVGALFIPLGYLLGPERLGAVSVGARAFFEPLFAFIVGWVGLVLGLQLNLRDLRTISRRYYLLALGDAAAAFGVAFGAYALLSGRVPGLPGLPWRVAAAFALLATTISPVPLFLFLRHHRIVTERARFLRFLATFNNVIVALSFGLLRFLDAPVLTLGTELPQLANAGVVLAMAVLMGIFFTLVGRAKMDGSEGFALVLGMVLLVSGFSAVLGASSIFVNLLVGAIIANVSSKGQELLSLLARYEKHLYVVLLLLGGVSLVVDADGGWLGLRWFVVSLALLPLARVVGGRVIRQELPSRLAGLGLVGRGGLCVALAMEYHGWLEPVYASAAMLIAAGGLFVTSFIAPILLNVVGIEEAAR